MLLNEIDPHLHPSSQRALVPNHRDKRGGAWLQTVPFYAILDPRSKCKALRLSIGIDDFKEMIEDVLVTSTKVQMITRPRRFSKTMEVTHERQEQRT